MTDTKPSDVDGLVVRVCAECRHYRDAFCRNVDAPYGGKVRLPIQGCFAFGGSNAR